MISKLLEDFRGEKNRDCQILIITCDVVEGAPPFDFIIKGFGGAGLALPAWFSGDEGTQAVTEIAENIASFIPGAALVPEGGCKLSPDHIAGWVASSLASESRQRRIPALLTIDNVDRLSGDGVKFLSALLRSMKMREAEMAPLTASRDSLALGDSGKTLPLDNATRIVIEWEESELRKCLETIMAPACHHNAGADSIRVPGFFINWAAHLKQKAICSVDRAAGQSNLDDKGSNLGIPETILQSAAATLDGLDKECLDLLQIAACDGEHFHAGCGGAGRREIGRRSGFVCWSGARIGGIIIDLPETTISDSTMSWCADSF